MPSLADNESSRSRFTWISVVGILIAAFIAYSDSFNGPFVYDDIGSIPDNPSIRQLWPVGSALRPPHGTGSTVEGRPILNLSLAVNYAFGGTKVFGYHLVNILVHAIAGVVLFGLVRRTLRAPVFKGDFAKDSDILATSVALLWTLHPLQTGSVTYVVQRAESLMGLFYLLTLYGFVRSIPASGFSGTTASASVARQPATPVSDGSSGGASPVSGLQDCRGTARPIRLWSALSLAACLLGMGTKEVMVTAPVMVLVFDRIFFAGSFLNAWRVRRSYYLCLAATWIPLAVLIAGAGGNRSGSVGFGSGVTWAAYGLTQFKAVVRYLRLAIYPSPLVFDYGPFLASPSEAAPYALLVGLLGVAAIWALARRPALGFLGFWFFGILAVTSLTPGTSEMIVERRMYLPLAGIVVLAVVGLHAWLGRRAAPAWVALASVLACMTWRRNLDYRTDVSLWSDTVAKVPANSRAQYDLGVALAGKERKDEAIACYFEALRLDPNNVEAHHTLANALAARGDTRDAFEHFRVAESLKRGDPGIPLDFGTVLYRQGDAAAAIDQFREAARLDPSNAAAHDKLGVALARSGRRAEAISQFDEALKISPSNAETHLNRGTVLSEAGRNSEAVSEYEATLRLAPENAGAHRNLGMALLEAGKPGEAIPHLEAALRSRGDDADTLRNLGVALAAVGRTDESKARFAAAARLLDSGL